MTTGKTIALTIQTFISKVVSLLLKILVINTGYRIQDAWGWCTGMIQRDDMGWEVGGGVQDWELMYTRG